MSAWIQVTGWTLVHFVWQGAAIAGVTAGGLRLLRTATPNARYAVASAGLCAMLVSPIITAHLLSANTPTIVVSGIASPRLPSAVASSSAPDLHRATSDSRRGRLPAGPVKWDTVLTMLVAVWLAGVALLLLRLAGGWWKVRGLHRPRSPRPRHVGNRARVSPACCMCGASCTSSNPWLWTRRQSWAGGVRSSSSPSPRSPA